MRGKMNSAFNQLPTLQSPPATDSSNPLPARQASHGFLDLSSSESSLSAELFSNQANGAKSAGSQGKSSSTGAASSAARQNGSTRVRRRNRLITSCLECRRRKLKCDRSAPCNNCNKNGRDCLFIANTNDSLTQSKIAELKEKMGSLERGLEKNIAKKQMMTSEANSGGSFGKEGSQDSANDLQADGGEREEEDDDEDHENLEPSPLVTTDAAYEENPDDDLVDLGVQLGKMRITDRIGGLFRPKFADELNVLLREEEPLAELSPSGNSSQSPQVQLKNQSFLEPGAEYLDPSAAVFLGRAVNAESIASFLPTKSTTDRLMNRYWYACHPICRIIYRPLFEQRYSLMWAQISINEEPSSSFVALTLAALLSAAISSPEATILEEYNIAHNQLVDRIKTSAEMVLFKANFLRTSKLETLQAFVLYLISLCRSEVSRAHSALTGSAIRLAECMGLHRDGTKYNLSPAEVHIRRMVWFQLCYLDIRTFEATGPRPQIRKEDFDTKFPLNVDDADLENPFPPTKDSEQWTEMTISLIRFEWGEVIRMIWAESTKIEQKKTTITAVLRKITEIRAASEKKYSGMLDITTPLGLLAFHIYSLFASRPYVALLARYHNSVKRSIPSRLRHVVVSSSLGILENAIAIETTPSLAPWAWYSGAFQQYHTALLMLVDSLMHPDDQFADRVWTCLDHAFILSPDLPRRKKAILVLSELRDRMGAYQSLRKPRASAGMEHQYAQMYGSASKRQEEEKKVRLEREKLRQRQQEQAEEERHLSQLMTQPQEPLNGVAPFQPTTTFPLGGLASNTNMPDMTFPAKMGHVPLGYYNQQEQQLQLQPQSQIPAMLPVDKALDPATALTPDSNSGDSSCNNDMVLDIDWDEWDKIFQANNAFDIGSTWQLDNNNLTFGPLF